MWNWSRNWQQRRYGESIFSVLYACVRIWSQSFRLQLLSDMHRHKTKLSLNFCNSFFMLFAQISELIPLWFGVECAERFWDTRVNPYQGIREIAQTSTVQRYNRLERNAYERMYARTNEIEVHIVRAVSGKWMIFRKKRPRMVLVRSAGTFCWYIERSICFKRWRQRLNFTRFIPPNSLYRWLQESEETITKTSRGSERAENAKEQDGTIFDERRPWIRRWEKDIAVIDHTVLRVRDFFTCYNTEYALHSRTKGFFQFQSQAI